MLLRLLVVLSMALVLNGCIVSSGTHKRVLAQVQNLEAEKAALSGERDRLSADIKAMETNLDKKDKEVLALAESLKKSDKDKIEAEAKLKELEQETQQKALEIVKLKKDVDDIRIAKEKETDEIKYKVREIQLRAESLLNKIKEVQSIGAK